MQIRLGFKSGRTILITTDALTVGAWLAREIGEKDRLALHHWSASDTIAFDLTQLESIEKVSE